MGIRPFDVRHDYPRLVELLPRFYTYPDHPEWTLQQDEAEYFRDVGAMVYHWWPLIRIAQVLMPSLGDVMRGYVWDDDGQMVGVMNYFRQGGSDRWLAGNAGVLPTYRQKGIARELATAALADAIRRGARVIIAEVMEGNVAVLGLAAAYGMTRFSGSVELEHSGIEGPATEALPDSYVAEDLDWYDWRLRYDLARRITPPDVVQFLGLSEAEFREAPFLRPLRAVARRWMGLQYAGLVVRKHGQVVGTGTRLIKTKGGGFNSIEVSVDPDHALIARYLVYRMTAGSLGRRIQLMVETWQPHVISAALALGFVQRRSVLKLGVVLQRGHDVRNADHRGSKPA